MKTERKVRIYKIIRKRVTFDQLPPPKNQYPYHSDYFRECRPQALSDMTRQFDYVGKFNLLSKERDNMSYNSKLTNRRKKKITTTIIKTEPVQFPFNNE